MAGPELSPWYGAKWMVAPAQGPLRAHPNLTSSSQGFLVIHGSLPAQAVPAHEHLHPTPAVAAERAGNTHRSLDSW